MTTRHESRSDSADQGAGEAEKNANPEEIEVDIERACEELGETVEALTARLDVKTPAQQEFAAKRERALAQARVAKARAAAVTARAKDSGTDDRGQVKSAVPIGGATVLAVVAAIVTVVVWRRGR
jgi:hypothetical protein